MSAKIQAIKFESDVISDGTQTFCSSSKSNGWFESDVISDGTQSAALIHGLVTQFESNVISDGTQTIYNGLLQGSLV